MGEPRRVRLLYEALAERPGEPVPFDRLVTAVWGDRPPERPRAALRNLVLRLRQTEDVVTEPSGYRLRTHSVIPRQLPAPPRVFVGRKEEIERLDETRGGTISAAGGIGKTWLAVHWAHRNLHRFPDGQLYANLRGYTLSAQPLSVSDVAYSFLSALGVDHSAIPVSGDERTALFQRLVAKRRLLVLLDNVRDLDHVTPLVPSDGDCTVLITTRHRTGSGIELGLLDDAEAENLLTDHIGPERVAAEPAAAAELLRLCGGLPLAISIVAARANAQPHFPLAVLADELGDEAARLDVLDGGDISTNLRAVFSASRRALSRRTELVFELLGLPNAPDIGTKAVAALAGTDASAELSELSAANLVQEHEPGRFRMHDLIRIFCAERAPTSEDAVRRLVTYYLHTTYRCERMINPNRAPLDLTATADEEIADEEIADEQAALRWIDVEHGCVRDAMRLAQERGWDETVWQLSWSLITYYWRRARLLDQLESIEAGLAAAERLQALDNQATAHRLLGNVHSELGNGPESLAHLRKALALAQRAGDIVSEAHTHRALAWALDGQAGDQRAALGHAEQALRIFRSIGHVAGEPVALNAVGRHLAQLGRYAEAEEHCLLALARYREQDDSWGEADALARLGFIAQRTGRHDEALERYTRARELFQGVGDVLEETTALTELGEAHASAGDLTTAREAWHECLELLRGHHSPVQVERIEGLLAASEGR